MKTYRTSPAGRRTIIILLIGALIIWAFAIWTFRSTLGISYNPLLFWGTLQASINSGLAIGQIVPALLMLVLIIATPLVIWNLLEEWAAAYTPTEAGLRYESLGIALTIPWETISGARRIDGDSEEPFDELLLTADPGAQIANPALRFLHGQAYGRRKLPLYAGIEAREELLAEIMRHTGAAAPAPAAADGSAA
jgi:hypothetical protein